MTTHTTSETQDARAFPLPPRSITMSERRIMVTKFGVNWDACELDLADIPQPADPDHPTQPEQLAAARAFTRVVGPNEKFALLYIAVKRQLPHATEKEIETHADDGRWVLDLNPTTGGTDGGSEATGGPLPAPLSEPN